jgi:hypothetical protein
MRTQHKGQRDQRMIDRTAEPRWSQRRLQGPHPPRHPRDERWGTTAREPDTNLIQPRAPLTLRPLLNPLDPDTDDTVPAPGGPTP